MGPPIFIGGNRAFGGGRAFQFTGFNGAADFHRRKCRNTKRMATMSCWLQWGRRFSSAEICRYENGVYRNRAASMGPPIFIGGNNAIGPAGADVHAASMGPPIFIGGNGLPAPAGAQYPRGFNGAADFHRRKSPYRARDNYALAARLQWGRRFSSAEI